MTMTCYQKRSFQIKRYTSWVLVLFVVSILNMSLQIPAHAAMQMDMQQQGMMGMHEGMMDHSNMPDMDMQNCECPPTLCDSVEAQQDQLFQSLSSLIQLDLLAFYPTLVQTQLDSLHQSSGLLYQHYDRQYRKISPPPLSVTSTLLI